MKFNKSLYTTLIVVVLTFTACNEEKLDVEPVGEFFSDNYYVTDEQVYTALIAAYDPIGWSMAFGNWISPVMYAEIRSNNANAGGDPSNNDQPAWQEIDDLAETDANTVAQPIYRKNYIGILRANLVIERPDFTSPSVERYKAEAKFLRAFYHFELFKHFGPVPVVTSLLTPDDINLPRNSMTEVFQQIEKDLLEAIEVLPVTLSTSEAGRASRGAAQALLGKAYIYWADMAGDDAATFDKAADQLRSVINSQQYVLVDDFNQLFSYGFKNGPESVFEIQHSNLWPSDWGWFEGIEGNGVTQLCGIRGLCADHPFITPGWGFMLPTQDLYDHFENDDQYRRRAAIISLADIEQTLLDSGIATCATPVSLTEQNQVDYTGYWQGKYVNYKSYMGNNVNGGDPNLTKDPNMYAIRYADVLLLLAEALHRGSGSDAEAMQFIDQVRERAAGPGDNTGNFRTAQQLMNDNGWSLQDVVWYERRAELAGEGHRWYDLIRSGRATADEFSGDPLRSGNFEERRRWMPIALEETSVATGLTTYPDASLFQ